MCKCANISKGLKDGSGIVIYLLNLTSCEKWFICLIIDKNSTLHKSSQQFFISSEMTKTLIFFNISFV